MHREYRFDLIGTENIYSNCEISPSGYKFEGGYINSMSGVRDFLLYSIFKNQISKNI
jgi:hypothetical protein